jgi:hypothetical protein
MRPAQRNSRKPLTVVLFQRLCLCSWVASAAVREQDRTSRTEQNSPSTTHTMLLLLLRWYHAWYRGMSRTGCIGRTFCPMAASSRVRPAASPRNHHYAISDSPLHVPYKQCYKATYHSSIPYESCIPCILLRRHWQAWHTSHDRTGGDWMSPSPLCARCTHARDASWAPP